MKKPAKNQKRAEKKTEKYERRAAEITALNDKTHPNRPR